MRNGKRFYRLPIVIEHDSAGYFASCPVLQGCYSHGTTYEEALHNIRDAVRLHIMDRKASREPIPQPQEISLTSLDVAV